MMSVHAVDGVDRIQLIEQTKRHLSALQAKTTHAFVRQRRVRLDPAADGSIYVTAELPTRPPSTQLRPTNSDPPLQGSMIDVAWCTAA